MDVIRALFRSLIFSLFLADFVFIKVNFKREFCSQMGSLLAIHTAPSSGPTRTPLQNILETSSLVHHKNPAVEGPVVS